MSDQHPHVSDFIAENYSELREQRGLSWDELAEQFRRDGHTHLEAWARDKAKSSDKSARANRNDPKPEKAVRNAPSRRA